MEKEFLEKIQNKIEEVKKAKKSVEKMDPYRWETKKIERKKYMLLYLDKELEMLTLMLRAPELARIDLMTDEEVEEYKVEHEMKDSATRWEVRNNMLGGYSNKSLRKLNQTYKSRLEGNKGTELYIYAGVVNDLEQVFEMANRVVDYGNEKHKVFLNKSEEFMQKRAKMLEEKKRKVVELIPKDEIRDGKFWNFHILNYMTNNLDYALDAISTAAVNLEENKLLDEIYTIVKEEKEKSSSPTM